MTTLDRSVLWKIGFVIVTCIGLAGVLLKRSKLKRHVMQTQGSAPMKDDHASLLAGASGGNTQYLDRHEGRIAYDDTDDAGQVVICVPGIGDLRTEYRYLAPKLKEEGYRIVTMDIRGHGESSTVWPNYSAVGVGADILALAHHLDAGPVIVIGTSMAAGAAVWAAVKEPQTIKGLVLIGPFVREIGPHWKTRALSLLFNILFRWPWGAIIWNRYYRSLYPTVKPVDLEPYASMLKAHLHQPGRLRALRKMMTAGNPDAEERLLRVRTPALVLMGSKDPDFSDPAAEARLIGERLRGKVQIVEGAGHYPHAEMPAQATPIILRFLHQLMSARQHV